MTFSNTTEENKIYHIVVKSYLYGNSGTDFKILSNLVIHNSSTNNKHIFGHPGYPNVIGVAAYNADDQIQVANYSSWGPLRMYSSATSSWSNQETPLITATSGVHTFVGSAGYWKYDDGTNEDPFYGTSAAAPHIAAIAGLYLSKYPSRTGSDFIEDLKATAVTIGNGTTGGTWNQKSGYGKADALACLERAEINANAPVFSPPSQTVSGSYIDVTISTSIAGAEIHYNLNQLYDPTISSPIYNTGTPIHLTSTATIKAKAFSGTYESPLAVGTYIFAGQGSITINSISPTVVQPDQSTVTTTVSYTRQRKWPNAYPQPPAPSHDPGCLWWIEVFIDEVRKTNLEPPLCSTENNFQFSYAFEEGDHTIQLKQWETDELECGLSVSLHYGTSDITTPIHIEKLLQVTIQNEFKDPDNSVSYGGFVNVDNGNDIDTDPLESQQYITPLMKGSTHTLNAKEQFHTPYYRKFNPYPEHDGGWVKINSTNREYNSIISPVINQTGTYTAKYLNRYDVHLTQGNLVEGGNGGTYKIDGTNIGDEWLTGIWQYDPVEAIPPTNYIFINWSDGNNINPMPILSNDPSNIYAISTVPRKLCKILITS